MKTGQIKNKESLTELLGNIDLPLLRRAEGMGIDRAYYEETPNGDHMMYCGVSAFMVHMRGLNPKTTEVVPSFLKMWRSSLVSNGYKPSEVTMYRADYGTMMHMVYEELAMGQEVPMENSKLRDYMLNSIDFVSALGEPRIHEIMNNMVTGKTLRGGYRLQRRDEIQRDVQSFLQWVKDYEVEFLLTEFIFRSKTYNFATPFDNLVRLTKTTIEEGYFGEVYKTSNKSKGITKGDPKLSKRSVKTRHLAVVDYKSGDHEFSENNKIQLYLSKKLCEENMPGVEVDVYANFAPKKEYRTTPAYRFQDHLADDTNADLFKLVDYLMPVGSEHFLKHGKQNPKMVTYSGVASIKSDKVDFKVIRSITDIIRERNG